jgi:hypothetical protein
MKHGVKVAMKIIHSTVSHVTHTIATEMIIGMFKALPIVKVAMKITLTTVKTMTSTSIMMTLAHVRKTLYLDMSVGVEVTFTIIVASLM